MKFQADDSVNNWRTATNGFERLGQPFAPSERGGRGAVVHAELVEDVLNVGRHRPTADEKLFSDLLGGMGRVRCTLPKGEFAHMFVRGATTRKSHSSGGNCTSSFLESKKAGQMM